MDFGSETTFMYFFSTLAQVTAALAGLLFVAAQFYIQFLDQKITNIKSYIINDLHPSNFNYYFYSWEASDAIKAVKKKNPENLALTKQAERLAKKLRLIQNSRKNCRDVSIFLISLTFVFVCQIPFVFLFVNLHNCGKTVVVVINLLIFLLGLISLGWVVSKSMEVKLRNKL